ncbi:insulin-like [Limulus polyphemus]|uniref:Insulin-like n=1 Tax=Limulus polyphemus TaxID=6850 RepID=A0ABM1RW00_LIMPO|nr:insulin-like [Limulus polyphemus]
MLILICVGAVVTSLATALPSQHLIATRSQRLCGPELAEALSLVCGGIYYTPYKRLEHGVFNKDMDTVPWWRLVKEMDTSSDDAYLGRKIAMSLFRKSDTFSRPIRGVTDECCIKSCSISELMTYCGAGGKK